MRSKSFLARPRAEKASEATPPAPRPIAAIGALTLVTDAETDRQPAKKHGLY